MKRAEVVRGYGGVSAADRIAERRRKLLAAGRRIWGESGVSDVTIRGVCAAAGLTPRYFYEQFPNREALLFAVSDDVRDELLQAIVLAGIGDPGTLKDKLRSAIQAFLEILAADPHIHRIATQDVSSVAGLAEHRTRILDMIADAVVQYTPDVLGPDTPNRQEWKRVAQFIVGGANQLIENWLDDPKEPPAELAAAIANLCVAAVGGIAHSYKKSGSLS
ncbi:TetR family transcriptional regulator [Mycobacterium intermedium]|uniref:TetR family transcriptional regulator n=1 Tax=Mycobacterium intermedium TaxID=28445 RepID=A0A1E3S7F4_MYCIE|nr:TetR/AcrR family transcriptional regulator [Mycobacterium intermedium]MCV6966282.1 TetR/AcrR family transcriptional regulator [Mycobacterium intermedium]ODQ98095.1 transcriptional regulator [Mycobacterium intermedium]OPE47161.1 TetR family transcriptional regulator [Mycobacterium intermedium]ORA99665.1 TetR family transcriptional regulator [Mycobacterium intermedium]